MDKAINYGYADTPVGQIHYRYSGQGKPLILMHGCPLSSAIYDAALPALGDSCYSIAPDIPGYGSSPPPPSALSIIDYAERIKLFIDTLGFKNIALVGYHTGAAISIYIAATYPALVHSLLVIGAPLFSVEDRQKWLVDKNYLESFPLAQDGSHLTWLWNRYKGLLGPDASAELIHMLTTEFLRHAMRYEWAYGAAFNFDGTPYLPNIQCPTYYLINRGDMLSAKNEQAISLTPKATGKITEGGYGPFPLRYPDVFVKETIEFIKRTGYI